MNHKTSIMFYYCSIIPLFFCLLSLYQKMFVWYSRHSYWWRESVQYYCSTWFYLRSCRTRQKWAVPASVTNCTSRYPASVTKVHQDLRHQSHGVNKLGLNIEKIILGKIKMWLGWRWEMTTCRCWYDSESKWHPLMEVKVLVSLTMMLYLGW